MISKSTIDKIYQTAIIEEVVGEFVHLKRSGTAYKGLSPFANEKTPSFFVVPSKGIYKDFSSGKGGNVVDFLMQHEKLSYPEALRWLAAKYQIDIEEDTTTAEQQAEKSEREQLSIVTDFANRYFQQQLLETEEGKAIGLSYFEERGFTRATIEKFQLGYCPDKRDSMTKAALEGGYSLEYLKKAGLTREKDDGPYDFFRGRVIFPIHNISGKAIAFGARTLKTEKEVAKYYNSPESELYLKSNVLYGLHLAKNSMVKHDVCYLVEGYTDVISMHQAGVENVVASSGTSLTEGQIKLIKRYTSNITILYDGDSAGIKASFRGIDMILKEGMNVRVLLFPDGDDPDSFSRKNSTSVIQDFIHGNAQDFITFKTTILSADAGNDPIKRSALIRNIVDSIALIPDGITRSVYARQCSDLLGIAESVLLSELNKQFLNNYKKKNNEQPLEETPVIDDLSKSGVPDQAAQPVFSSYHQEEDLIRLLLNYGQESFELQVQNEDGHPELHNVNFAEYLITSLQVDEVLPEIPKFLKIFNEYAELMSDNNLPDASKFTLHQDQEISSASSSMVFSPYTLSSNWSVRHMIYPETEEMQLAKAAQDCIYRLKLKKVLTNIKALENEIAATALDNEEKLIALMTEKKMWDKAKVELAKYWGSSII